jgi:hypothetical protein
VELHLLDKTSYQVGTTEFGEQAKCNRLDALNRLRNVCRTTQFSATSACWLAEHVKYATNNVMLAPLAGAHMFEFENRFSAFTPNVGQPAFVTGVFPPAQKNDAANRSPMAVQIAEIYQAAVQRAKEEHEIDRLFNAEFYNDYQI